MESRWTLESYRHFIAAVRRRIDPDFTASQAIALASAEYDGRGSLESRRDVIGDYMALESRRDVVGDYMALAALVGAWG